MNDHERGFILFLAEPSRRRVETLLSLGEKRRGKLRDLLSHGLRLDEHSCRPLTGRDSQAEAIEAALRDQGAPASAYLIAADRQLDGREMAVGEAVAAVLRACDGAFLSCIPGRLAYYQYEPPGPAFLLLR